MTAKDYFILGCKLFGVYCMFLGIPSLISAVPAFIQPKNIDADFQRIHTATTFFAILIPIVYIAIGSYLIRCTEHIYQIAYSEGSSAEIDIEGKFTLFIKMLGMFLLISYFPDLLRTISSYIVYSNAPMVFEMRSEKQFAYLNAASSICGVVFGVYLLVGGKYIVKLALSSSTTNKKIENDLQK